MHIHINVLTSEYASQAVMLVYTRDSQSISKGIKWFSMEVSVGSVRHDVIGDIRNLCDIGR